MKRVCDVCKEEAETVPVYNAQRCQYHRICAPCLHGDTYRGGKYPNRRSGIVSLVKARLREAFGIRNPPGKG